MADTEDDKESLARVHLPYRAEYCKTSRARCKKCTNIMEAGTVKLANMTKSRFHDGYDATYYHIDCFFQIKRPSSVAEIRYFETLKYEDQKTLEEAIETNGKSILGTAIVEKDDSKQKKKRATKRSQESSGDVLVNYDDFLIEYAKSNRSKCNLCEQKIDKDSVRLGKLDYEADTPWRGGPVPRWFHIECFVKSMEQLEFYGYVDKIKNFDDLEDADQKELKKKIKPIKPSGKTETASKKMKTKDQKTLEKEAEEEILLKKQSDRYFKLRDKVNTMKRKDIELLMNHMEQKTTFVTTSLLVDLATDVLLFGPLKRCPECKQTKGMMLYGGKYICTRGSEWAPCPYKTKEPKRDVPDIPEEISDKYDFFKNYKFRGGKRLFSSKFIQAVKKKEAEDNNIVEEGAPLDGLTIGLTSWKAINIEKSKIQKRVTTLGGKLQTNPDKSCFIILSSKEELAKETPKIEVAKALNVPFAKADFLLKIETKEDVIPELKKCLIGDWEGDLEARFNQMNVTQLKSNIKSRSAANIQKSVYKSGSVAKSQTLVVKNGTAVDPESGYSEVGHVYRSEDSIYSVVLNCVDVAKDKNSFYKIQIIEHSSKKSYMLFKSWGRIGCSVGGNTCKSMSNLAEAIEIFEQTFEEKTGNPFSSISSGTFKKIHGLYFPIELDYGDTNKELQQKLEYSPNSKLEKEVQEFISFVFDIKRMQLAMKQFELDMEKMPLGKLSKKHISEAMSTLQELQEVLEVKPPNKPKREALIALTNKFYSHIPQSFGDGEVKLIDSLKQVEEKNNMLASLSEIEVAYNMCTTIDATIEQLPVDQHYMQLNCAISLVNNDGKEFELISDYIQQTHATTHGNYKLDVQNIFRVQREEDMKRFKVHKNKARSILWHGSRTTNFAGILKDGLRIAPKEAPSTGYMFGKGIYFADMSSKAANYCLTDPDNNVGLLLLCEVALGKMHEVLESEPDFPKGLPEDCHSVKGVGKSITDPKTHIKFEDDILVPIGKQISNKKVKSQLLYNEYVVYQESQVMIRFIVQCKFKFN